MSLWVIAAVTVSVTIAANFLHKEDKVGVQQANGTRFLFCCSLTHFEPPVRGVGTPASLRAARRAGPAALHRRRLGAGQMESDALDSRWTPFSFVPYTDFPFQSVVGYFRYAITIHAEWITEFFSKFCCRDRRSTGALGRCRRHQRLRRHHRPSLRPHTGPHLGNEQQLL